MFMQFGAEFDTYKIFKILTGYGIPEKEAEGIIEAIKESHSTIATKQDLVLSKNEIIIKIGTMFAAGFGLLLAVLKMWH